MNTTPTIQFHDNTAIADTAFTVKAPTKESLFEYSAIALISSMATITKIKPLEKITIKIESEKLDLLLFDFLNELIFYKDSKGLLFSKFKTEITKQKDVFKLKAEIWGEHADTEKHLITIDIKAITMHMFEVRKTEEGFQAHIVIDI